MFDPAKGRAHVVLAIETSLDGMVGIHYVVRRQGLERVKGKGWRPVYYVIESRLARDPEDVADVEATLRTWVQLYRPECVSLALARQLRRRKVSLPTGMQVVDIGRMR